jgi:hypothetical protein
LPQCPLPRKPNFFAPRDPNVPREKPGAPKSPRPSQRPKLGIFTTTHWEYPSQHYTSERVLTPEEVAEGKTRFMQGDKNYAGATPSWVIWQLLMRYTKPGELVVDPMCGSGTTIDVAHDLKRKVEVLRPRADAARHRAGGCPQDSAGRCERGLRLRRSAVLDAH